METQNDNHCSNALAEIEAGAAMLDGMLPDLVERIVEVDGGDPHLCRPTRWVPYPFDLVTRMYMAQCHQLARAPQGNRDLPVIASMQFALSWDRTIVHIEPTLAKAYQGRGMPADSAFSSLFKTPKQTYYVALQGVISSYAFDALWVFLDVHPENRQTHLRIHPTSFNDATPAVLTVPFLAVPEAATWEEAVDRGAWQDAQQLRQFTDVPPDQVARAKRIQSMAWEPVVALLVDLLTGDTARNLLELSGTALRSDARIANVVARTNGAGAVGFTY